MTEPDRLTHPKTATDLTELQCVSQSIGQLGHRLRRCKPGSKRHKELWDSLTELEIKAEALVYAILQPGGASDTLPALEGVSGKYQTMSRRQLVDEIDRYATNYNALERSRDACRRDYNALEAFCESLESILSQEQAEVLEKLLTRIDYPIPPVFVVQDVAPEGVIPRFASETEAQEALEDGAEVFRLQKGVIEGYIHYDSHGWTPCVNVPVAVARLLFDGDARER